jgi:regulator of replication initiation timing
MSDLIRAYESENNRLQIQLDVLRDRVGKVEDAVTKQNDAHNAFIPQIYSDIGKIQAETNSMKNMVIKLQWSVIGAGMLLILNIVMKAGGF